MWKRHQHQASCKMPGGRLYLFHPRTPWFRQKMDTEAILFWLLSLQTSASSTKECSHGIVDPTPPPKKIEMFICSLHFFFARRQKRPQGGIQVSSQILPCFHLQDFQAIFAALEECFGFHPDCEVTMEMDPGTFSGLENAKMGCCWGGGWEDSNGRTRRVLSEKLFRGRENGEDGEYNYQKVTVCGNWWKMLRAKLLKYAV